MAKRRILVIDADPNLSEEAPSLLESRGYEVLGPIDSVEGAVSLAAEALPDVALISVSSPEERDGMETARRIKAVSSPVIVFMTPCSTGVSFERAKQTQTYAHVTKPFSLEDLEAAIEIALSRRRARIRPDEKERKSRLPYERTPSGYQSLDKDGHVIEANRAWLDTLGYSREEVVGKWFGDFLAHGNRQRFRTDFDKFKKAGSAQAVVYEMIRKDGARIIVSFDAGIALDDSGEFLRTHCIPTDVTQEKLAERALIESEERYRTIFEHAGIGIAHVGFDGTWIHANRKLCEILGYTGRELMSLSFQDASHPEDLAAGLQARIDLLAGKIETYVGERRYVRKDGEIMWGNLTLALGKDSSGNPSYFVVVIEDISERKRAEQEALLERKRLRSLWKIARLADDETSLTDLVLSEAMDLTDSRHSFMGYISEDQTEMTVCAWSRDAMGECKVQGETLSFPLDEETVWALAAKGKKAVIRNGCAVPGSLKKGPVEGHIALERVLLVPVTRPGRVVSIVGLANKPRDYTEDDARQIEAFTSGVMTIVERRSAEEALKKSQENYRSVVNSFEGLIYVVSPEYRIEFVNRSLMERTEYDPAGEECHKALHGLDHRCPWCETDAVFRGETVQTEALSPRDNRWYAVTTTPISHQDGSNSAMGIAQDITEGKKAEEQLRRSLDEKQVLLREIHHRVKNNLAVINSILTLRSEYSPDKPPRDMFDEVKTRIQSMAIAHEILYQSDNLAYLNVSDYIENLLTHLLHFHGSVGSQIVVDKEIEEVSFGLDTAIPLGFLLTELVSNCLEHAFPDGRAGRVRLALRSLNEHEFELIVADNGIGIPDSVDWENPQSMGFELIDAFVEQLHGRIEINRSEGTTVRIGFNEIGHEVER